MTNMEKLLDALDDCGEAALFYKGKKIKMAKLPAMYTADFRSKSNNKLPLQLTVVKTSMTDGALLVVLQKKEA